MVNGPLLVGEDYLLEQIIALSESRRTESNWILSRVYHAETKELVAEAILNSATLKDSMPTMRPTLPPWVKTVGLR